MEGSLLVLVPIALLVMTFVGVAMFVDVALLGGDRIVEERERLARLWRPPYVMGRELLGWARETGASMARALLSEHGKDTSVTEVSARLHEGATRAMLPEASDRHVRRRVACPEGGQGTIGVTALEAIEIAEQIRKKLPKKRQARLLAEALEASADLRNVDGWGDTLPPPCALQGEDRCCLTYQARPLRCRALHAVTICRYLDDGAHGHGGPGPDAFRAKVVAEGVEEGWIQALGEAGLDGNVYELNSAVAVALTTPDVVTRWAEGEGVFDDCLPGPSSAFHLQERRASCTC